MAVIINTGAGRRRLSSEGPVTSGEQYGRTCQRPNTERGYQHPGREGGPPTGGRQTWRKSLDREHRETAAFLGLCLHRGREAGSYFVPST